MGSAAAADTISYLKTLSRGSGNTGNGGSGGGNDNNFGNGDGSGNQGRQPRAQELFQVSVDEDDDDDDDDDDDEDEDEDEEEEEEEEEEVQKRKKRPKRKSKKKKDSDDEDDSTSIDPSAPFYVQEVVSQGLMEGPGVPREEDLFAGLNCQPGFVCDPQELGRDLQNLSQTEGVDGVDVRVIPIKGARGKCRVKFKFYSKKFPKLKSFRVEGAKAIPQEVIDQVMDVYNKELEEGVIDPNITMKTLGLMRFVVEKWYQDRGYIMSYIKQFDGLDKGEVVAKVVEGRVNRISVMFVDDEGMEKRRGNATPPSYVKRELSFTQGMLYNQEDSRRALRDLIATGYYENVQVLPEQSKKDEKLIDVTVMVKERPMRTTEIEFDWKMRSQNGLPVPEAFIPGATIAVDNRNLFNKGYSLTGTVTTSNLFDPRDIGYKVEWRKPYVFGTGDPNRTSLGVIIFNTRRVSGVFTPGPWGDEIPPIFVQRSGGKVSLQEFYNCNSRGSIGLVAQEIVTFDDSGAVVTRGFRGQSQSDGPPTTLGEGQDQQIFLQADVVRDTTYSVNGSPIGSRDIYQVDQGTGIGGFFNRQVASLTRFIKLKDPVGMKAPPTLVLHGRVGNCIGDLASYDAFCLGGPYSVRGVNIGELGVCRRFLEASTELRLPTPFFNHQMYGFFEYGTDLGSSEDVPGNPTVFYRKPGSGKTTGGGLKFGPLRLEYARDLNLGRGTLMFGIGERF